MRYRIGTDPSKPVVDHASYLEAGLGIVIGIVLVVIALRGRQRWLVVWGASLIVAAGLYLGALLLGIGTSVGA